MLQDSFGLGQMSYFPSSYLWSSHACLHNKFSICFYQHKLLWVSCHRTKRLGRLEIFIVYIERLLLERTCFTSLRETLRILHTHDKAKSDQSLLPCTSLPLKEDYCYWDWFKRQSTCISVFRSCADLTVLASMKSIAWPRHWDGLM